MEKLKILSVIEKTTSKGDPYKVVSVENMGGATIEGITAFKFKFPALETLVAGAEIEGSIVIDGNYKNLVSAIEKPKGNPAYKSQQIEKSMERKENSISKFQDTKELRIKVASSMNKAIDLAIAEIKDIRTLNTLEQDILKWRTWIWEHWDLDITDTNPLN